MSFGGIGSANVHFLMKEMSWSGNFSTNFPLVVDRLERARGFADVLPKQLRCERDEEISTLSITEKTSLVIFWPERAAATKSSTSCNARAPRCGQ